MITVIAGFIIGVGTLMQPSAGVPGGTPPVSHTVIVTQGGTPIATQSGLKLIKQ